MPPNGASRRFAVALSFSGVHRDRAEGIATHLASKLGSERVLYDRWYREEFARFNLDTYLTSLYREQSELLVVFLNAPYAESEWCGLEWRVVRELIKQRRRVNGATAVRSL